MAKFGKTLKVHVMGQYANALKSVELSNWTGLAFVGERQHLAEMKARQELAEPGIYFLVSDNPEDSALTDIYIGETDDFSQRIVSHAQNKDWWDRVIVFVSKDANLTKAHVKYLEKKLFVIAKNSITNLRVKNSNEPNGASLPESDISSMEEFLSNILFVLETLGLSYFTVEELEEEIKVKEYKGTIEGQEFYMTLPKDLSPNGDSLRSFMYIKNGMYVLKSGAYIRAEPPASFEGHSYSKLWKQITTSDSVKISDKPGLLETIKDIEFRSPSAVGGIVRSRATNGRTDWKRVSDDLPLFKCELMSVGDKEAA